MTRLLTTVLAGVLLALLALAALWLLGQLLQGLGGVLAGLAGLLLGLLRYLLVAGVLGGVVYFLASAWRLPRSAARRG